MAQSKPEISWRDNIVTFGQRFSRVMEERFQIEVQSGVAVLPPGIGENKFVEECGVEMFEIYLEYLFGTAVAIACHYCSTTEEFEENIVALVRDKFVQIRKMKSEGVFRDRKQQEAP